MKSWLTGVCLALVCCAAAPLAARTPVAGDSSLTAREMLRLPQPVYPLTAGLHNRQFRNNSVFLPPFADAPKKARSPRGAMLRSALLPGWGQYYNGKLLKAALVFGVETFFVTSAIVRNQKVVASTDPVIRSYWIDQRNNMSWAFLATRLLSVLDAYVDAHLSDFDDSPDLSLQSSSPGMYLAVSFSVRF